MIVLQIIGIIILAAIAAVTYRMGGSGNYPRWTRQVGVCTCMTLGLMSLGFIHWTLILCYGAMYGLSTTYFKKKGTDAFWWNWMLVGLAFGIAVLPIVLVYHNWIGFGIRTAACTLLVVAWSEGHSQVVWEEGGRGVIPIITLPLLLLG